MIARSVVCIVSKVICLLMLSFTWASAATPKLQPQPIKLKNGVTFFLNAAAGYTITPVMEGLHRPRFMTMSPDHRLFVTDMHDKTDNRKGSVYILEDQDPGSKDFRKATIYLDHLRNPNSVMFAQDKGIQWLYVATTDTLFRYQYHSGEEHPSSAPQVIATFPGYGLSYKYGGWHLTRTLALGPDNKIYVSIGSGCDACDSMEAVRATILQMNLDGSEQHIYVSGLRNAVGIKWVRGKLYASNMGQDKLGNNLPNDTFYEIEQGRFYGWPYYYQGNRRINADPKFASVKKKYPMSAVPLAYTTFFAHSAPLGIEYFGAQNTDPVLNGYFLVALHGTLIPDLNRGYSIARLKKGEAPTDVITGFRQNKITYGRPVDILNVGPNSFYFTDDHRGVIYYVTK